MLKKLGFSIPLVLALTACGGGSDDDHNSTQGSNNGGNQNTGMKCDRGIPSGMAPLGKGALDEVLYSFDQQSDFDQITHKATTQLIEDKIQLIKHTQYIETKAISHPNNDVDTSSHSFDYMFNSHGAFTTKHYAATQFGWPQGYVSKMDNDKITFNAFNDQCDLSIDSGDYTLEKIDLSDKTVATIFERDPSTTTIVYKFIEQGLGYFLNPSYASTDTQEKYSQIFNNMLKSDVKFPAGSYVYIMKQVKQNDTAYLFDEDPTDLSTFEDWAKHYPATVQWKTLSISGYQVYQAYKKDDSLDCVKDPAILKGGKIYDGECHAAAPTITDLNENNQFYMNQTARDAVRAQLKAYYGFN